MIDNMHCMITPPIINHQRQNLWRFMSEKLGIEEPEKVWRPLFQKYNQTAKGLRCVRMHFQSIPSY